MGARSLELLGVFTPHLCPLLAQRPVLPVTVCYPIVAHGVVPPRPGCRVSPKCVIQPCQDPHKQLPS